MGKRQVALLRRQFRYLLQFSYDLNGYRTAKTVNGVRHTYLYAGGKLLRETYSGNTLDFAYDAQGLPFS